MDDDLAQSWNFPKFKGVAVNRELEVWNFTTKKKALIACWDGLVFVEHDSRTCPKYWKHARELKTSIVNTTEIKTKE